MRIFFDVDYTILSSDYRLRSGTRDTWERLVSDGHEVHVWSGEGTRHQVLRHHGVDDLVAGVYRKPIFDFVERLPIVGVDGIPDFVIDDYPEIVHVFGGFHVREFYSAADDDDEMQQIYDAITEWVATGASTHRRWKPRRATFAPSPPDRRA